jgi:integrase
MPRVNLKGIHKVRKTLASGKVVEYHRAWRGKGAPTFWNSDGKIKIGSAEYIAAFAASAPASPAQGKFRSVITEFMDSQDFNKFSVRYQKDIRTSLFHPTNGIDQEFGDGPLAAINDPRIRRVVLKWRDRIGGKVGDDRLRHLQRIIKFGLDRSLLTENRLKDIKSVYKADRADIFWSPEEIDAFETMAPKHIGRILVALCETGLRPGDLYRLSLFNVEKTPKGQRIVVRTNKRKRPASIPVTRRMAKLIAETPRDQATILVGKKGRPYKNPNYLGDAVSTARDDIIKGARDKGLPDPFRPDLRLYDARGTAATRLLRAGGEIGEIATAMGWSIKHATEIIEAYVRLHPDMADGLGAKIERYDARTKL